MSTEKSNTFDRKGTLDSPEHIPSQDFIHSQFDQDVASETKDVFLLLSTPRSGSTLLCDLIFRNSECLAHEYFQNHDYMPKLAHRWGCVFDGSLDEERYIQKLLRFRTSPHGWLGINLHGSHLRTFLKFEEYLCEYKFHYVHIVRRNIIAQAVSLEMANQTGQWRSEFKKVKEGEYSYENIFNRMAHIQRYNTLSQAYIISKNVAYHTVYYEDLCANTADVLLQIPCIEPKFNLETKSSIKKQRSDINDAWITRFSNDFLSGSKQRGSGKDTSIFGKIRRLCGAS